MQNITSKDTKQSILDAYEILLEKYQSLEQEKSGISLNTQTRQMVVPKAHDFFEWLEWLKKQFLSDMDIYAQKTREKFAVIDVLSEALIDVENRLQEWEKIQTQVASLYALIELQNNKRREFDELQELKNREQRQKEQDWQYAFEEKKRSEEFTWKQKKEEWERKWNEEITKKMSLLNEREAVIFNQEESMKALAQENKDIKQVIDTLPKQIETTVTSQLQKEFDIEKRFLAKEWEMQAWTMQMTIKNLEEKLSDLQKQYADLQKLLSIAHTRIESFATKIVESGRPIMMNKISE